MKKVEVHLYGRLRDAGHGGRVLVDFKEGMTVQDLISALRRILGDGGESLVGCAIATEREVLPPSAPVPKNASLAALPPVCGG